MHTQINVDGGLYRSSLWLCSQAAFRMLPELRACQIFIDLGNVQGCFTIQLHRLQGDFDPHWQCLINHRHGVLTALSFLSSIQAIGELFSNHYCFCFSFKKKNHKEQRKKERTDLVTWWMVLANVCTEGWWDFKSCKQKSCVSPQASQDAIICTLFLLWRADQVILVFSTNFQTGLFPISVCSGHGPFCMPAHYTRQLSFCYWLCGRLNYFYHSSRWVVFQPQVERSFRNSRGEA